ncbi:MAG TPA: hypothetical protein VF112_00305 [Candidatus Dormibacteraeota bacterium]
MTSPTLTAQPIGHTTPAEWLWVVGVVALLVAVSGWLVATGDSPPRPWPFSWLGRASSSLHRVTGLPGWCAGGVLLHGWALLAAGLGFFWDVSWHIDLGRDTQLFTPAHTLILIGLAGLGAAGVLSVALATLDRAPTAWSWRSLRVPRGAAALLAIGAGGVTGFPLDDLWHANYGVDVTMWGPTHLLMIGSAVVSPIAIWLLLGEAGHDTGRPRWRDGLWFGAAVGLLVAFSAMQLEFDDGVPQWQALYQPVLIGFSATMPMVAARVALGRWAAVRVTIAFLLVRGVVALVVGPVLGHTTPHIPLYIGIALCVEAGYALTARRSALTSALTAGVLAGTAGLATEWGWSHVWGREPWQPQMLHGIWAAALIAVAGAVLGAALAGAAFWRRPMVPVRATALAGAAAIGLLVVPFPRQSAPVTATIHTTAAGPSQPTIDRFGRASIHQDVTVAVDVSPASTIRGNDFFWVKAWQGEGMVTARLVETSPGHWEERTAVPTGGTWKTILLFGKGSLVMAAPVVMPSDPEYGQGAISLQPQRTEPMVAASKVLMRESHGGAAWPAVVAYSALGLVTLIWLAVLVAGAVSLVRGGGPPGRPAPSRPRRGFARTAAASR